MSASAKAVYPLVLFASLLISGFFSTQAAALAPSTKPTTSVWGVTISPVIRQVNLSTGLLVAKTDLMITNNTSHDFNAKMLLVDFKALDEYGGITLGQAGVPIQKYGLAKWMNLVGGNTIHLSSGQSDNLEVDIDNSADLTPGGHYGAVVLATASNGGNMSSKVALNQNLVSLYFVNKSGGDVYGMQLQSVHANPSDSIPTSITMLFRSTGNVYVIPRGYIEVTDPLGKIVSKGIINQSSELIMQGSSEQLNSTMQLIQKTSLPGRYKIAVYYRYEGQPNYNTKIIYFNRTNWTTELAWVAIVTGVIILIIVLRLVRSKRKKRPNFNPLDHF